MNIEVESTDRGPRDFLHFGLCFFGLIIAIAGVLTTTVGAAICGLVLIMFGMAYFALEG